MSDASKDQMRRRIEIYCLASLQVVRNLSLCEVPIQPLRAGSAKMRLSTLAVVVGLLRQLVAADSNLTSPQSSQQILTGDFKPPQVFENENVVRNTNLEKGYVRETINLVVKNIDMQPQSEYYLPFEHDVMGKVGGLEVRDKKNPEKGKFELTTAAIAGVLDIDVTSSKSVCLQRLFTH